MYRLIWPGMPRVIEENNGVPATKSTVTMGSISALDRSEELQNTFATSHLKEIFTMSGRTQITTGLQDFFLQGDDRAPFDQLEASCFLETCGVMLPKDLVFDPPAI
ncbi:hypothetical protein LTS08_003450 [Lithohypha guttulata]|nr:hypothetical protein LTS08_003450 [Lithohypha guttulata]